MRAALSELTEETALGEVEAEGAPLLAENAVAPLDLDAARPSLGRALLRAVRPRQWAKNVLVLAAPGAAGVLDEGPVMVDVALAFVSFCLVASASYLLNDAVDVEADRRHPVKRHRPVAAGAVSVRTAVAAGVVLMLAGFGVALAVGLGYLGLLAFYVALTTSYTLWLKRVEVIDMGVVASGFILRAIAGGVAAGVPLSRWFLIVASFGSLFMVAGKRHGEHLDLGADRGATRTTLAAYSSGYLHYVWTMASGVTVAAYCLWAFEQAKREVAIGDVSLPLYELSIVPFVLGVLRYALLIEAGRGGAPEEVVLGDRTLQLIGLAWVVVFGCAVYLAH